MTAFESVVGERDLPASGDNKQSNNVSRQVIGDWMKNGNSVFSQATQGEDSAALFLNSLKITAGGKDLSANRADSQEKAKPAAGYKNEGLEKQASSPQYLTAAKLQDGKKPAEDLIKQLDHDDFDTREKGSKVAEKFLKDNINKPTDDISPLMKKLASDESSDTEVRRRLDKVLSELGKDPNTMAKMLGHDNESLKSWSKNHLSNSQTLLDDLPKVASAAEKEGNKDAQETINKIADPIKYDLDKKVFGEKAGEHWDESSKLKTSVKEADFSKMDGKERNKLVEEIEKNAKELVQNADKTGAQPMSALARIMYPEKDRIPGSSLMGERIAAMPGGQRVDAASALADLANKFKDAGGEQKTIDRLQKLAADNMNEVPALAGEYKNNAYFQNTLARVKKLNPEQFGKMDAAKLLRDD